MNIWDDGNGNCSCPEDDNFGMMPKCPAFQEWDKKSKKAQRIRDTKEKRDGELLEEDDE